MLTDWYITGAGGQAIVSEGGSKRCRLTATKQMLWNGRSNLVNSEIVVQNLLNSNNGFAKGGLMLRSDLSGNNCYRLMISYSRAYYIQKVVAGIVTTLAATYSTQSWNVYVKTRLRVDGWQLSVDDWINGAWVQVAVIIDTEQSVAQGYAGLFGASSNADYNVTFDDVAISERV